MIAEPNPAVAPASSQSGFTLVELLVALALLSVVLGFVSGGLRFAIQASEATRVLDRQAALVAARETLADCIGAALPVSRIDQDGRIGLAFGGASERLDLVCALAAGEITQGRQIVRLVLRMRELASRQDVVLDEEAFSSRLDASSPGVPPATHLLVADAHSLAIRYFGDAGDGGGLRWQHSWSDPSRLPELVEIGIGFHPGELRSWPDLVVRTHAEPK